MASSLQTPTLKNRQIELAKFSETSIQSDIQEAQYEFPYHYVPHHQNGVFTRNLYWSWGHRYIGGMHAVKTLLERLSFKKLIDVGCGDGRLLRDLSAIYPDCSFRGIDKSESAIAFAKAFNPELDYIAGDIKDQPSSTFEVATSVEVLEHIPPHYLPNFVESIAKCLTKDGYLVGTVPHINQPVSSKHFQHFSLKTFKDAISSHFELVHSEFLDPSSKLLFLFDKFLGGTGDTFIISNKKLNTAFMNMYLKRYLFATGEENCKRLGFIAKRKK